MSHAASVQLGSRPLTTKSRKAAPATAAGWKPKKGKPPVKKKAPIKLQAKKPDVRLLARKKKAKKTQVEILCILDSSGSMMPHREKMVEAFNTYIKNLRKDRKSTYVMSLVKFDYGTNVVFAARPIKSVKPLTLADYDVGGGTAMNDAIGFSLKGMQMFSDKSSKSLVMIMTDGEENASKKFTTDEVRAEISRLQAFGNWTFVFFGSEMETWQQAQRYGISMGNVMHVHPQNLMRTMDFMTKGTETFAAAACGSTNSYFADAGIDNSAPVSSSLTPLATVITDDDKTS